MMQRAGALLLLGLGQCQAQCKTDEDCSLAGVCQSNGQCECDAAFKGGKCSQLNLLPIDPEQLDAYDRAPQTSSWGGNVVYAKEDGKWHLFFAEFLNNCGLYSWETNSVVAHAVADKPEGPYKKQGIVLEAFHHNPSIAQAPDGTYLLYSIGDGNQNGTIVPKDCTSSSEPKLQDAPQAGIMKLAYSKSVNGPWTMLPDPILTGRPGEWDAFVTNPSVYIFNNGTVLLAYRGGWAPWHVGIAVAPSWKGPYTRASDSPAFEDVNEDPGLFRDARGNFHMLTHYFQTTTGHAYSRDGLSWTFTGSVYDHSLPLSNGTQLAVARHERPQILSLNNEPAYLFTGVLINGNSPSRTVIQAFHRSSTELQV